MRKVKEEKEECVVQRDEIIITAVLVAGTSSSISGWIYSPAMARVFVAWLKVMLV